MSNDSIYKLTMSLIRDKILLTENYEFGNSSVDPQMEERNRKAELIEKIKEMMNNTSKPSELCYGYAALKKYGDVNYKHPSINLNLKKPINIAKTFELSSDEKFQKFFSELKSCCSNAAWFGNWFEMIFVAYSHLNFNFSFDMITNDKFKNYLHMLLPCYYENFTGQLYSEVDRKREFIMQNLKAMMDKPVLMYNRTCMRSYLHFLTLKCYLEDSSLPEKEFVYFMNAIDRCVFMYFDNNVKQLENFLSMIIMKSFFTIRDYANDGSYDFDYQVRAVMNPETGKYGKIDLLIGNLIIDVKTCAIKTDEEEKEIETYAHFYQMLLYKEHIGISDEITYLVTLNPITNLITFYDC